ncbi:uncharacterized protein MKK02DRAFT_31111 [Dioszegia hungarica]|uniref:Ankyrin n=1 Tax=Dioszegia hungarica TaxID=4972 RepID=A0AA38HCZ2_9TREE|nr:uncharacterized protein MKK02DRAFT_31111 [Dioszegia hungarica]KAI9638792.1 hypothetical protein MKK02DRAFT_31111 [Dioszegia hungarica]
MPSTKPSAEESDEFLLSCRYGELEEVQAYISQFGEEAIVEARDNRGNTALHMCCANGHIDILQALLPHLPPSFLQQTNTAGSPPLHWAILNNQVAVVKLLSELPEEKGGGLPLLHQQNRAKRDAFTEALFHGEGKEEIAGYIEGYLFKAEGDGTDGEGEIKMTAGEVEEAQEGDKGAEEEAVKELEEKAKDVRIGEQ